MAKDVFDNSASQVGSFRWRLIQSLVEAVYVRAERHCPRLIRRVRVLRRTRSWRLNKEDGGNSKVHLWWNAKTTPTPSPLSESAESSTAYLKPRDISLREGPRRLIHLLHVGRPDRDADANAHRGRRYRTYSKLWPDSYLLHAADTSSLS